MWLMLFFGKHSRVLFLGNAFWVTAFTIFLCWHISLHLQPQYVPDLCCTDHTMKNRDVIHCSLFYPFLVYNITLTTKWFHLLLKSPLFEGRHQIYLVHFPISRTLLAHRKFNNICSMNVPSPTQWLTREYLNDKFVFKMSFLVGFWSRQDAYRFVPLCPC